MSFVKKAVKSVFKVVKKVVKKAVSFVKRVVKSDWFKIAAIVALTVFTAGVGSGLGFAAFSGVTNVGGFFAAVGETMSVGWGAITSSVSGLFSGGASASAPAVGAGTQPLMTAGLEGTGGLLGSGAAAGTGASGFVAPLASNVGTALTGTAASGATAGMTSLYTQIPGAGGGKGILAKIGGLLMDKGVAGTALRSGIVQGINWYAKKDQMERDEFYRHNRTVWGGPAFGGSAEGDMPFLRLGEDASFAQQQAATEGMTPLEVARMEEEQAMQEQGGMEQAPQYAGMLGVNNYGPPPPNQQQGAAQAPMQNQPPPAYNPQQASAPGLLNLETAGAYVG